MAGKQKYTPSRILAALKEHGGRIHLTAHALQCTPETIGNYAKRYPVIREALDGFRERRLDRAENILEEAVEDGQAWAVCFFLKTQGKSRGYVERQELTGGDGQPLIKTYLGIDTTKV